MSNPTDKSLQPKADDSTSLDEQIEEEVLRILGISHLPHEHESKIYVHVPGVIEAAKIRIPRLIAQHIKDQGYIKADDVDRFEVIDDTGRAYVKGSIYGTPVSVKLSVQDDARTLKVFVTPNTEHTNEGKA